MAVAGEWNFDFQDTDLQSMLEEGETGEAVFLPREAASLCAVTHDTPDAVADRMMYSASEAAEHCPRLQTPPPSGGGEGEALFEHFLLSDEPCGDAKPMPCHAGPQPSTPEEARASSSTSTTAPQSPSLSNSATPPPEHGAKRRREGEEAWSEGASMCGSGDLHIRPEDDPLGLFQRDPNTLTSEELKLLKKQKRLIKNRESAQLSRHRKKQHVEGLQAQV
jgi:hypothetical protein